MKYDAWSRRIITEQDVCDALYTNPDTTMDHLYLDDPTKHNRAIDLNFSDLCKVKQFETIIDSPDQWHATNQQSWNMPDEYYSLDIAEWVLSQCKDDAELARCQEELEEYRRRDLLLMLSYLKYLVDILRENKVLWGVGRGSSVASFVLYKIGIHRINSLTYELDFYEFMK